MSNSEKGSSWESAYFYADPLAAAWMAKHFGMRFTNRSGAEVLYVTGTGFKKLYSAWEFLGSPDTGYIDNCFCIHAASLHLLSPKDGDRDGDDFEFCERTQAWWRENGFSMTGSGKPVNRAKLPEEGYTAKRDGKPFLWPEQEAA